MTVTEWLTKEVPFFDGISLTCEILQEVTQTRGATTKIPLMLLAYWILFYRMIGRNRQAKPIVMCCTYSQA